MPVAPSKNTASPSAGGETAPIPPRYWWLKRLLLGFASLILALLALRLGWGWYADRLLQAEIDRIVAAGEPIYPEDFDPVEPVADEDNAAKLLKDAESRLRLTPEQSQFLQNYSRNPEVIQARHDFVRAMIDANAEVLTLAHEATNVTGADWGLRMRTPAMNTMLPWYPGQRQLTKYLATAAVYFTHSGQHDEAVSTLNAMVVQGDVAMMMPSLLGNLVGMAANERGTEAIEYVAPRLRVAAGEKERLATSRAHPQRVQELIGRLLKPGAPQPTLRSAFLSERMLLLDIYREVRAGRTGPSTFSIGSTGRLSWREQIQVWLLAPAYTLNALWGATMARPFVEAAEAPTFLEAKRMLPEVPDDVEKTSLEELVQPIGWDSFSSLDRVFALYHRAVALRRMAGLSLAIRLYELDHGGRPERLEQLVPDYIPAVPIDPFGDGERLMGYAPKADPPVLYSIGEDGVDDGGRFELRPRGGVDMESLDLVFFLDGNRPRPEPESLEAGSGADAETGDEDTDVDDDGGEEDETEPQQQEPQ